MAMAAKKQAAESQPNIDMDLSRFIFSFTQGELYPFYSYLNPYLQVIVNDALLHKN